MLREWVNSYLLKDILAFERIQNSRKIKDLLPLIAYQTDSEVSYNELARQLGISKNTVERYLNLLAKVDILFSLNGFSNNPRKEIVKSSKWYFYDNGVRNALIGDFRLPALRQDMGALWESYCISERIKYNNYSQKDRRYYFWRTYDRQEIDLIETTAGKIQAFEFKWGKRKKKIPVFFAKTYPQADFSIIHPDNYLDFIS